MTLRLGTRGSALALAQARLVAELLDDHVELVPITTAGDRGDDSRAARAPRRDKGRFTKEIEDALLAGEVDLAVHSAKDVPAELPEGLSIVGVPERADPRDSLCGVRELSELPEGARVGTSSLRRRAQLAALRPDLEVCELRGNVDTRLSKLAEGGYDALVLASAGLARLGRSGEGQPIDSSTLVPAAGQGCLALEARTGDERAGESAAAVTRRDALAALTAERSLVAALEATCDTPVGAFAELRDGSLRLSAFIGMPDGSHWIRDSLEGDAGEPAALGAAAARRLESAGGRELLAAAERIA